MKLFLLGVLGTALAGGMAYAQQEEPIDPTQDPTQEQTTDYGQDVGEGDELDPMSDTEDPTHSEMDDPTMSETQPEESATQEQQSMPEEQSASQDELYGSVSGMDHGLADKAADELKGMTVVSETGEEIGEIDRVGQERVVTVDVGGFLGIAEKTISIPVSELQMSSDGNVQTKFSKEALEVHPEFDEQGFTEEGSDSADDSTSY